MLMKYTNIIFTFLSLLNLASSLNGPGRSLFPLQLSTTPVEVLDNNSNKHVEHEESNKEKE